MLDQTHLQTNNNQGLCCSPTHAILLEYTTSSCQLRVCCVSRSLKSCMKPVCLIRRNCKQTTIKAYAVLPHMSWSEQQAWLMSCCESASLTGCCWPQVHAEAMPEGPKNPYGNGFIGVETPLTSEAKAARVADGSKGTYWKVNNPTSRHPSTGKLADLICVNNACCPNACRHRPKHSIWSNVQDSCFKLLI